MGLRHLLAEELRQPVKGIRAACPLSHGGHRVLRHGQAASLSPSLLPKGEIFLVAIQRLFFMNPLVPWLPFDWLHVQTMR
jgi:hypothetical protein